MECYSSNDRSKAEVVGMCVAMGLGIAALIYFPKLADASMKGKGLEREVRDSYSVESVEGESYNSGNVVEKERGKGVYNFRTGWKYER